MNEESGVRVRRLAKVHALTFGDPPKNEDVPPETSRALPEKDLFAAWKDQIVTPPYNLGALATMAEQTSGLVAIFEAMETNIEGFGYRFSPRFRSEEPDVPEAITRALKKERVKLENFFATAATGESFTSLRRRTRRDLESTGNAYWEIIRNRREEIVGLKLIPSYQVRLVAEDENFTKLEVPVIQLTEDGDVELGTKVIYERLRRFIQGQYVLGNSQSWSAKVRWFKTFGDPRTFDSDTGEEVLAAEARDWDGQGNPMPEVRRANEIIHFRIYSSRTPYGIPRYIGALLNALGTRAAEEVNYKTLNNNNIPSMVVTVSNGQLTEQTVRRMKEFVDTQIRGNHNYSQILVLEGESGFDGEDAGQVRIEIKPLTNVQIQDALFTTYLKYNRDTLRQTWRLPPIFTGGTEDYNRATSESSRVLADEQVFAPERDDMDWRVNNYLLLNLGIRYYKFESNTPNVTDNRELIAMLSGAERTGGITPRISRSVVEDVFKVATDAPPLDPTKFDPDVPFSLTMAEKIQAANDPTEVNQNVAPVQPGREVGKAMQAAMIRDLVEVGNRATEELMKALGLTEVLDGELD